MQSSRCGRGTTTGPGLTPLDSRSREDAMGHEAHAPDQCIDRVQWFDWLVLRLRVTGC